MGNFFDVNIKLQGSNKKVKIQEGCRFENKNFAYTMRDDGKLSIFDKNTKKTTIGTDIKMTNYQFQIFSAVADNNNEQKGKVVLSEADIKTSMAQYKKGGFVKDLLKWLRGNYKVKNPKIFADENKFSAYISNGKQSTSSVLCFQYGVKTQKTSNSANVKPTNTATVDSNKPDKPQKIEKPVKTKGFTGTKLFSHPAIVEKKALVHTVKSGEDIVALAREYEVDTYQIIAANPQLKEGKDYKVTYPDGGLAKLKSTLKVGQEIVIPARYDVKAGSCKSIKDVARITGVSETYLKDFLTIIEVHASHPGEPDLETYLDDGGTPTIGYGHTGRVDGKPLSAKNKIKITPQKALEILAEDILKHKAMTMAYVGKENYMKAPKSVQEAVLDIAYNKGIWDGYMAPGYSKQTAKVKKDLANMHYASALVHSRREKTGYRGLQLRNLYRFISGLRDLTPKKRKAAMKEMKPYYEKVLKQCKKHDKWDYEYLKTAWKKAEEGTTTGYRMRINQK